MTRRCSWVGRALGVADRTVISGVSQSLTGPPCWSSPATLQAFIERPGEVDDVLNTGTSPYVLYVTFPRVPQGESARTDQTDPGTCPGI
jgi:hypothetical protein